nr:uncharacterized protein DKFZp434B061-like [Camelus dromedarius]
MRSPTTRGAPRETPSICLVSWGLAPIEMRPPQGQGAQGQGFGRPCRTEPAYSRGRSLQPPNGEKRRSAVCKPPGRRSAVCKPPSLRCAARAAPERQDDREPDTPHCTTRTPARADPKPQRQPAAYPDAPRGAGISSRSASPRQGVPRDGHCAAAAAAAATQRAGLPGVSMEPDPGAFPFTNRPSSGRLDHVHRPQPRRDLESPDPARRPLTPRAPPHPARLRVRPWRALPPRARSPASLCGVPCAPPWAVPTPPRASQLNAKVMTASGRSAAARAGLLTGSALPAADDRGPAAMPRLHPGRRTGSGVRGRAGTGEPAARCGSPAAPNQWLSGASALSPRLREPWGQEERSSPTPRRALTKQEQTVRSGQNPGTSSATAVIAAPPGSVPRVLGSRAGARGSRARSGPSPAVRVQTTPALGFTRARTSARTAVRLPPAAPGQPPSTPLWEARRGLMKRDAGKGATDGRGDSSIGVSRAPNPTFHKPNSPENLMFLLSLRQKPDRSDASAMTHRAGRERAPPPRFGVSGPLSGQAEAPPSGRRGPSSRKQPRRRVAGRSAGAATDRPGRGARDRSGLHLLHLPLILDTCDCI